MHGKRLTAAFLGAMGLCTGEQSLLQTLCCKQGWKSSARPTVWVMLRANATVTGRLWPAIAMPCSGGHVKYDTRCLRAHTGAVFQQTSECTHWMQAGHATFSVVKSNTLRVPLNHTLNVCVAVHALKVSHTSCDAYERAHVLIILSEG